MKMNIILMPQRRDDELVWVKQGDTLSVNGEVADFSQVQEGDTLPYGAIHSDFFPGEVVRVGGVLTITIIMAIPDNYSPEQAFPLPLVDVPDGLLDLPKPLPVQQSEEIV